MGKTHMAIGIGVEAIHRGYSVKFSTMADLVHLMKPKKSPVFQEPNSRGLLTPIYLLSTISCSWPWKSMKLIYFFSS